jgi:hypothetical protein
MIWILINLIEYQFGGYVGVEFINKRFAFVNSVATNAHVDAHTVRTFFLHTK